MERKFEELVNKTREELENIPVEQFCNTITLPPLSLKDQLSGCLGDIIPKITNADTIKEIFFLLNMHVWNYLNYSLLEHIVERYGSVKTKEMMQHYVSILTDFLRDTPLQVFWNIQPSKSIDFPSHLKQLVVQHKKSWSDSTLEDVEKFRQEVACEYSLYTFSLILAKIEKGSVIVTWLVSETVAQILTTDITPERLEFFRTLDIVQITVDDSIHVAPEPTEGKYLIVCPVATFQ